MIGASQQQGRPEDMPLPGLRAELELLPGAADANGKPTWLIHDPIMNRFVQIEPAARAALKQWRFSSTVGELIERINAEGHVQVDLPAVLIFIDFLYSSQLTEHPRLGGWRSFVSAKAAGRHSLPAWLVHNYLFFRIPLFKPQSFLEQTLPFARLLVARPMRYLVVMLGLVGLYLVSRQWEHFFAAFLDYFSWEGATAVGIALGFVKLAHELGHAFTAAHFGCRVHTMGIAFVVMAPMPYTDVTDAWRLTDRRKRLLIDSAGMIAEAAIAAIALFLWAFLPDGTIRNAAFVLCAVSVISSLAINLNPFMRFDGYYLLSEMLGVENLQSRAFAIGCWRLRETLFASGAPCPEDMPPRRLAMLTIYAWSVWIYRVILFTGIALLVYHYFFKVLGIVLFGVEIIYFIAKPIASELLTWWKMKSEILYTRRTKVTISGFSLAVIALFLPWSTKVEIPAVLEAAQLQSIYATRSARVAVVHVKHGDVVHAGQPIITLQSTDIDVELARARIAQKSAELQYGRRIADATDREGSLILESSIESLRTKIEGLEEEKGELSIVAPFDGKIVEINAELHAGRWLSPRDLIAIVAGEQSLVARGYAAEADVGRIELGAHAIFIPDHASRSGVDLVVDRISRAGAAQIEIADLASTNSGRIAVNLDERRRLVPASAQYLVTLTAPKSEVETELSVRGIVLANGQRESVFARVWRRAVGVVVRESGA